MRRIKDRKEYMDNINAVIRDYFYRILLKIDIEKKQGP
jgi:hypothetical protein